MKIEKTTEVGIDFLRGLFAFLVLVAHAIEAARKSLPPGSLTHPFFDWFYPGGFWVGGFFVLSGFCIGLTVIRHLEKGTYDIRSYYFQRFTRLAPIYFIGLLLATIAWQFNRSEGESFPLVGFSLNLTGLQNFFGGAFPFYGPSWSITNEIFYYLAFPFIVILGRKSIWRIFFAGLACYLLLTSISASIWLFVVDRSDKLIPFWTIPWCGVTWMFGFGTLCVLQHIQKSKQNHRYALRFFWFSLFILTATYFYRTWTIRADARAFTALIIGPVISIGVGSLILGLGHFNVFNAAKIKSYATWCGLLSYPLYLFHAPLQGLCQAFISSKNQHSEALLLLVIFIAVPLIACGTLGVTLEKFFLQKRKIWTQKKLPTHQAL